MDDSGGDGGARLDEAFGPGASPARRAYAPCRLSPLGAHTDHQRGLCSGMTLDRGITLRFRATSGPEVRLISTTFPDELRFSLSSIPPASGDWGDYPRGVARELVRRHGLARGIEGIIDAALPPGGVSTSAALQVAVLLALHAANDLPVDRAEAVEVVCAAERNEAGVAVGILDPTVILYGGERALVVIDCREGTPRLHRFPARFPPFELLLVDSGRPRDLRASLYNERVAECSQAARAIGVAGESPDLRGATPEAYRRARKDLDPVSMRRAEHFFSECRRVKRGLQALSSCDLDGFARLVTASGVSLTTFFECGTPETRDLLHLLLNSEGVLGASYAGGGFGGHLQAFARPGTGARLEEALMPDYAALHPGPAAALHVTTVGRGPGAHVV